MLNTKRLESQRKIPIGLNKIYRWKWLRSYSQTILWVRVRVRLRWHPDLFGTTEIISTLGRPFAGLFKVSLKVIVRAASQWVSANSSFKAESGTERWESWRRKKEGGKKIWADSTHALISFDISLFRAFLLQQIHYAFTFKIFFSLFELPFRFEMA